MALDLCDKTSSPPIGKLPALTKRPFLFLCAALGALLALIASLRSLRLQPARDVRISIAQSSGSSASRSFALSEVVLVIIRLFVAVSVVSAIVFAISVLITKRGRRAFFRIVLTAACLVLLLWAIQRRIGPVDLKLGSGTSVPQPKVREVADARPRASSPSWIGPIVTFMLAGLLALLALRNMAARRARNLPVGRSLNLASNAQDAADALRLGSDVGETIQRCYLDMCEMLQDERGVARHSAMTPGEFEIALRKYELPSESIATLTGLFEEIRYGGVVAVAEQKAKAIDSLEAIARACRT